MVWMFFKATSIIKGLHVVSVTFSYSSAVSTLQNIFKRAIAIPPFEQEPSWDIWFSLSLLLVINLFIFSRLLSKVFFIIITNVPSFICPALPFVFVLNAFDECHYLCPIQLIWDARKVKACMNNTQWNVSLCTEKPADLALRSHALTVSNTLICLPSAILEEYTITILKTL